MVPFVGGGTGSVTLDVGTIYPGDVFGASGFTDTRHDIFKLDIVADDGPAKENFYSAVQEAILIEILEYRNESQPISDGVQNPNTTCNSALAQLLTLMKVTMQHIEVWYLQQQMHLVVFRSDEIMSPFEVGFDFDSSSSRFN